MAHIQAHIDAAGLDGADGIQAQEFACPFQRHIAHSTCGGKGDPKGLRAIGQKHRLCDGQRIGINDAKGIAAPLLVTQTRPVGGNGEAARCFAHGDLGLFVVGDGVEDADGVVVLVYDPAPAVGTGPRSS